MLYIQRDTTWAFLVGILVFSVHLPDIFMGLYVRDEGRELTLSYLSWQHAIYYSKITVLSHWIAGWWNALTEPLGVIGSRLGAALLTSGSAAMCFPILRRFMPAYLALAGLLLTTIATDYAYVNFIGYRNIPSFFLYTALLLIFLLRSNKNAFEKNSWFFHLLIGLLIGLAAASKLSFMLGLFIPFIPVIYDTFQQDKFPKQAWITALIISLIGFLVWFGVWNKLTYQADFPSTVASGSNIIDYGLNLLKIYAIAINKSGVASLYLLVLLMIVCLSSIAGLSLKKYFFLSMILIGISYLLFGLSGLLCTLVLIGIGNHIKIKWLRWIGYFAAMLVAYQYMNFWYVGGVALVLLMKEIIGDESVKWKIIIQGLLLFGIAQFVGIKYHHTPLAICLLILIVRMGYEYFSKKAIDKEYILWVTLAIFTAFVTMIGSSIVFKNVETALWLLLPLGLFGQISRDKANPENHTNRITMRSVMATLLIAMSLCSLSTIDERELPKYRLIALCNHPALGYILTSPGRARSTSDVLTQLEKHAVSGDTILIYNHAPLFYYLTKTIPFLHEPWISAIPRKVLETRIRAKEQTGEMPVIVLRALADTRVQHWGALSTIYMPSGRNLKTKNMLDNWCLQHGYEVVWQNRDFQILKKKSQ